MSNTQVKKGKLSNAEFLRLCELFLIRNARRAIIRDVVVRLK